MNKDVIKIIEERWRENIFFVYPIKTPEKIAVMISALCNSNGGYIIFGVKNDGLNLHIKGVAFEINIDRINSNLESNIEYHYKSFDYKGNKIAYIQVDKSEELVSVKGVSYIMHNNIAQRIVQKSIFISYNHSDKDIAKLVESALVSSKVSVTRDENEVRYKDDLEVFMQSISQHDYTVAIVTDNYLKSVNCMYEVSELMRERSYYDKLLFIRINESDKTFYEDQSKHTVADIYSANRFKYVQYWVDKKNEIDMMAAKLSDPSHLTEISKESKKLNTISYNISEFVERLKNGLAIDFKELYDNEFAQFHSIIDN